MIEYEEDWLASLFFVGEFGIVIRASMFAVPTAALGVCLLYLEEWYPGIREQLGLNDLGSSTVWNAAVKCLAILLGFRTGQGFSRFWEGTSLLHMMRGEWFDTVSNCVTFSISAKKKFPEEVMKFRHALVRLMSLCHGSALEEISEYNIKLETIDPTGLDEGTLIHLKECHEEFGFNKVEIMLHLLQSLIIRSADDGLLAIPPPILSRVFQTISRGFVRLLNAKKITDTRFPFPYAQLITILLFVHTILTPMVITATVTSKVLAAVLCFVPTFGMHSLNFIASELENPFGTDANDLPMTHFQEEMNQCLMMLLHTNTDMISGTSNRCIRDFQELLDSMVTMGHSDEDEDADVEKSDSTKTLRRLSSFEKFLEEEAEKSKSLGDAANDTEPPPEPEPPAPPPPAPPPPPEPVKPAQPPLEKVIEQRLTALHPTYSKNLDMFMESLRLYTNCLEGQVNQLHETFAALRAVNSLRGWEAAVHPSP